MKNILVAIDGSETSDKALLEARTWAECLGSDITILHIQKAVYPYAHVMNNAQIYMAKETAEKQSEQSLLLLEETLLTFQDLPGKMIAINIIGDDPAEEIIKEASSGDYDLIIMGSRGLGLFSRAMLGSVSNKVLNGLSKNVLIVR